MGGPQSDQLDQASDHRPLERGPDLRQRVVVPVHRPALSGPRHRHLVVRAREQTHVVDLRTALREQLDGPCREVPLIVFPERRVVAAVELVDVHAVGVLVGQDPVDIAAPRAHDIREPMHLVRLHDPLEIGVHGDAGMAGQGGELARG